jgi:hypothetical protein
MALFTQTSIGPSSSSIRAAAASIWSASARDQAEVGALQRPTRP